MGFWARTAREWRYLRGLIGTLARVRGIASDSPNLVCDDWEKAAGRHGARTAISFEGRSLTYAQYDALANRFAHWALAQGLKRGDTVAIFLPNRLEYVAAWMGLAKVGVVGALVNNHLAGQALCHCIEIAHAAHVIADAETAPAFEAVQERLGAGAKLWTLDGPRAGAADLAAALAQLPDSRPDKSLREGIVAGETALYIYTSGTTGLPKAAKVAHIRAQTYMRAFAGATRATSDDKVFVVLPLYHATGGLCGVGAALMAGGEVVLRRRFSASSFWPDVTAERVTLFVYIGELCRYLVNQPEGPGERGHDLRMAFGNGLRPEVWERFQARFDIPHVLEFYGATEGNVSILNFDGKPGSVGRIAPYVRSRFNARLVRLDIETGEPVRGPDGFCQEVAPGEVGECLGQITDKARTQYAGYADKAASEKKLLRGAFAPGDVWFRTGDLMRQDTEGYFYFVDRLGDTFRWKGENVSTSEVAEVLASAPGVKEVNVYGVAVGDAEGRAGMAALVTGPDFSLEALAAHVDRELPVYARPLFLRLQPEIATTGTFKYTKTQLVEEGFDPARSPDPLYVRVPGEGWTPLTREIHADLKEGRLRV